MSDRRTLPLLALAAISIALMSPAAAQFTYVPLRTPWGDLPIGARVKVSGYRAKDGSFRANGTNITLADGRFRFLGSEGTGAPSDGRGQPNQ